MNTKWEFLLLVLTSACWTALFSLWCSNNNFLLLSLNTIYWVPMWMCQLLWKIKTTDWQIHNMCMRLGHLNAWVQSCKFWSNKYLGTPFLVHQAEPSIPFQSKRQTEHRISSSSLHALLPSPTSGPRWNTGLFVSPKPQRELFRQRQEKVSHSLPSPPHLLLQLIPKVSIILETWALVCH